MQNSQNEQPDSLTSAIPATVSAAASTSSLPSNIAVLGPPSSAGEDWEDDLQQGAGVKCVDQKLNDDDSVDALASELEQLALKSLFEALRGKADHVHDVHGPHSSQPAKHSERKKGKANSGGSTRPTKSLPRRAAKEVADDNDTYTGMTLAQECAASKCN